MKLFKFHLYAILIYFIILEFKYQKMITYIIFIITCNNYHNIS
jgi:hypothetical protein